MSRFKYRLNGDKMKKTANALFFFLKKFTTSQIEVSKASSTDTNCR